jgi:YD repeat-containing protein
MYTTTHYLVGYPATEEVYQGYVDAAQQPNPDAAQSTRWYIYADEDEPLSGSWDQEVGLKGELRAVRRYAGESQFVDIRYLHDDWGNVTHETAYNSYGAEGSWASANPLTTTTEYDPDHHTFPITVTQPAVNSLSLVEARKYYEVNESNGSGSGLPGQLKRVQDVNNGTDTSYQYDAFGRLTKLVQPGDSFGDPTRETLYLEGEEMDWQNGPRALVVTWHKVADDIPEPWTRKYYDGLGRLVQTQGPAEDWVDEGGGQSGGHDIVQYTLYDALGRVAKESLPFEVEAYDLHGDPAYTSYVTPTNEAGTTYVYDALGRTTVVTNSDGTTVTTAYRGWEQAVVDENGHQKVQRSDAFGRLISVSEYTGTLASPDFDVQPYATTAYAYDVLDNLVAVTDTLSNVTTMEYDMLGRKTAMDDPDMGEWSYTYNALGNLVSQTDALSQTIAFEYDELNRLTEKDYPSGDDVYYQYDDAKGDATTANSWGRLRVTYVGNETTNGRLYEYDDRGRVVTDTVKIDGDVYNTLYSYDAMDRVVTTIYPGGEVVTTTYNAQGLPETLTNADEYEYVEGADYNALGQPEQVWFGGAGLGLTTRYSYDSQNHRLQTLRVGEPGYGGKHLYLIYAYDDVGNVSCITEWRGGVRQRQLFGYDALDRLTSAATSGTGTWGTYDRTYEYDKVGNLTYHEGLGYYYKYSGGKPHAVTHLSSTPTGSGTQHYWYDANPTPLRYGDCAAT